MLPASKKVLIIAAVSIASIVATAQASRQGESEWRARATGAALTGPSQLDCGGGLGLSIADQRRH